MQEPFEFFPCFLEGSGSVRVVLSDRWITIQRIQRCQIPRLKMAKEKAFGFQDDHEPR